MKETQNLERGFKRFLNMENQFKNFIYEDFYFFLHYINKNKWNTIWMVCSIDDWKRRKLVKNEIRNNNNYGRGNRYILFIDRNSFDN